jgi:hypothetical protein
VNYATEKGGGRMGLLGGKGGEELQTGLENGVRLRGNCEIWYSLLLEEPR